MSEQFDRHGVRIFSAKSLAAYFFNRQYLEQELVLLSHADDDEADEVFLAIQQIAVEFRKRHVHKLVLGKINMNKNQVVEDFQVYRYPSVHLIFSSQDGKMLGQEIEAKSKKELFHMIFQYSQVLTRDYDDRMYYEIMDPPQIVISPPPPPPPVIPKHKKANVIRVEVESTPPPIEVILSEKDEEVDEEVERERIRREVDRKRR